MNEFKEKGYTIVKFLDDTLLYRSYILEHEYEGDMLNEQVPGSPSFYNHFNNLQVKLLPKMEEITGLELYKTYNFSRIYKPGAILTPHSDREACEISVTMNLSEGDWEIGIFDRDNIPHTYTLKDGEGLVYHGCDLVHWRPGKCKKEQVQTFLHYVDKNGNNSWCKDDLRR